MPSTQPPPHILSAVTFCSMMQRAPLLPERPLRTENLGMMDYETVSQRMLAYTQLRSTEPQPDIILFCEHPPVYTQGIAGREEHLLCPGNIPVIRSNRGGQITYHGPGQLIAYPLLHLRERGFFVREFVSRLESAAIATLKHFGIAGVRAPGAPGVYVQISTPVQTGTATSSDEQHPQHMGLAKIAALGIKVSRGFSYHGIALNVHMDTRPFRRINPCGYAGLETIDMQHLRPTVTTADVLPVFEQQLLHFLTPNTQQHGQ